VSDLVIRRSDLLGTPQQQLGVLLESFAGVPGTSQSSVRATYPLILGMRCARCNAPAGVRCSTARGGVTYPHTARIEDAVAFVAHLIRTESRTTTRTTEGEA
jgi:hypothetical protein